MYTFTTIPISDMTSFKKLSHLLSGEKVHVYHEMGEFDRLSMDGVVTLIGEINGQKVGVINTDFRVFGGSFSKRNSQRVCKFIQTMSEMHLPIVFGLNSLGVRFIEGRTVFDDAFSIISALCQFRKENLLITFGLNKVLGISALLFAQGHYRIAVRDEAEFNLTGPEVHKTFFGNVDARFSDFTNSTHQFERNTLIHELLPTQELVYKSAADIINFLYNKNSSENTFHKRFSDETEFESTVLRNDETNMLKKLELELGENVIELFSQKGLVVRVYIGKTAQGLVGYLVNPPTHPNNMLTVNAVDKAVAAIELFKVLKLPVVSIMDSPGGDPRKAESDKDAIMKMIKLTHDMIDYPYPKMGVIIGRCYGGAAMFNFPRIFGGLKVFAVEGARVGVMHKEIINILLSKTPRLKEIWDRVSETETYDFKDLIECGTIDSVISFQQIKSSIQDTLFGKDGPNEKEKKQGEDTMETLLNILPEKYNGYHLATLSDSIKKVTTYANK